MNSYAQIEGGPMFFWETDESAAFFNALKSKSWKAFRALGRNVRTPAFAVALLGVAVGSAMDMTRNPIAPEEAHTTAQTNGTAAEPASPDSTPRGESVTVLSDLARHVTSERTHASRMYDAPARNTDEYVDIPDANAALPVSAGHEIITRAQDGTYLIVELNGTVRTIPQEEVPAYLNHLPISTD